jgi:hypothetical protein
MAKEWREALCPVCGTSHGMVGIPVEGKPYIKIGKVNYWDRTATFDPDKAFGVVKSSEGRGTMKIVRTYDIDEDEEGYFPLIKARVLQVLKEGLAKGWWTKAEVQKVLAGD